jgi:hypothetical protein
LTLPPLFVATAIHLVPQSGDVAKSAAAPASSDLDPAALAALNRIGTYVRDRGVFRMRAQTSEENVLTDREKDDAARARFAARSASFSGACARCRAGSGARNQRHMSKQKKRPRIAEALPLIYSL